MSDLRTRIAGVIAAHGFAGYAPEDSYTNANWPCSCDWVGRTAPEYQQHVADAVIRELDSQGLLIDSEAGNRLNILKEQAREEWADNE